MDLPYISKTYCTKKIENIKDFYELKNICNKNVI